jgi:type II secretory pathway component PulK
MPLNPRHSSAATSARPRSRPAAALLLVLISLAFLAFIVTQILASGTQILIWESQRSEGGELRREAFSALESTLGALGAFSRMDDSLYGPAQGWADPLEFTGYTPPEGLRVTITLRDESGYYGIPALSANPALMSRLLQDLGLGDSEAQSLAACLADWVDTGDGVRANGAERESYPEGIAPPNRPIQSLDELRHVKGFDTTFFNDDGTGNELWEKFSASVSLLSNSATPNINTAPRAVLEILAVRGGFSPDTILSAREGARGVANNAVVYRNAADLGLGGLPPGLGNSVSFTCSRLRIIARASRGDAAVVVDTLLDTSTPSGQFPFTILQQRVNAMLQE